MASFTYFHHSHCFKLSPFLSLRPSSSCPSQFFYWNRSIAKGQSHKLPPGPWKLPFIGNLHQLVFSLPHRSLRDLAMKYGPIMQLQLGEVLAITISSPKVAEEVPKTHDAVFANRPTVLTIEVICYDNSSLIFSPCQVLDLCKLDCLT